MGPDLPKETIYELKYSDGKTYTCKNVSGIKKVEFYHANGYYYITYADGSHERSSVAPGIDDYPQKIGTFNPADGSNDAFYGDDTKIKTNTGLLSRILGVFSTGLNAYFNGESVSEAVSNYMNGQEYEYQFNYSDDGTYTPRTVNYTPINASDFPSNVEFPKIKEALVNKARSLQGTEYYSQNDREKVIRGKKY